MNTCKILLIILISIYSLDSFSLSPRYMKTDRNEPEDTNSVTIYYSASDDIIFNPERGHYTHKSFTNQYSTPLTADALKSIRDDQKISLVFTIYYLGEFIDKPVSDKMLQLIDNNMSNLRQAGLKCVLRFAYKSGVKNEPWDPPLEITLEHISQLKPVLEKNSDVIAVMEAGFIGVWGEWYYSTNFGYPVPDYPKRKILLESLLDALPDSRMICVRTPVFKMRLMESGPENYLTEQDAYNRTVKARIGHHNDCFLASNNDFGTYQNLDQEKLFLEKDSRFVAVGGETCNPSDYAECTNTLIEMERFHWSYLNKDYHQGVINRWKGENCYAEIVKRLGYRFILLEGQFDRSSYPGGSLRIRLAIVNEGFAAPFNKYIPELILEHESGIKYRVSIPDDPGKWIPGNITVSTEVGIPRDALTGSYRLFLNIAPSEESLRLNPFYSIRLANNELWDAKRGYNRLVDIKLKRNTVSDPNFSGIHMFQKF